MVVRRIRNAYSELWAMVRLQPVRHPEWRRFWILWFPLFAALMVVANLVSTTVSLVACVLLVLLALLAERTRNRR